MATSDSPLSVPDVTLAVARALGAANAGGTPALSWSAPDGLGDNKRIIIETDGTYDFGQGPDPSFTYYMDLDQYSEGDPVQSADTFDSNGGGYVYDNGMGLIRGKSVGAGNTPNGNLRGVFRKLNPSALNGAELFREVFFTYTQRIPNDINFTGPGNQKPFWIMLGNRGDNFNFPAPDGTEGHDLYVIGATGGGGWGDTVLAGNNGEPMPKAGGWTLGSFATDQWFCKAKPEPNHHDAPDDYYVSRTTLSTGTDFVRGASSGPFDQTPDRQSIYQAFAWDRVKVLGYYNAVNDRTTETYQSGIYLAAGPNAWAHVDLCDSANEAATSKRVIAKPVSWTNNRIEVVLNAGNVDLSAEGVLQIRKGNGELLSVSIGGV